MSTFNWLGGDLSLSTSWSQPDPQNPTVPGPLDNAVLSVGGALVGGLGVSSASFVGGVYDLQTAISASNELTFSDVTGSPETDVTIEAGSSFTAAQEALGGMGVARITQLGGSNITTDDTAEFGIDTGSSYDLQAGTFTAASYLAIDGGSTFTQSGGVSTVFGLTDDDGSYELDGGTLAVGSGNEFVGDIINKTASFTQTDGIHTIDGSLSIGQTGTGTFELTGGSLSSDAEFIGDRSTGSFVQTGGTHTVSDRIVLGINLIGTTAANGNGSYTLGGDGALSVQTVFVGSDPDSTGTFNFNQDASDAATLEISGTGGFPGLIVGGEGIGTFNQGHGDVDTTLVVGRLVTGDGTYNFFDGTLTSTDEEIGSGGQGKLVQDDGINTANGAGLVVGSKSTADGTYDLNGGTIVAASETIGELGAGTLVQNGGTNTVSGAFVVGDANVGDATGVYTLGGDGTFVAQSDITLGNQSTGDGTFNFNTVAGDAATLALAQNHTLTIGSAGTGLFVQGGGTLSAILEIGAQASGDGTFHLINGNFSSTSETIGDGGTGTITQDGGTNTVTTGDLIIGNSEGDNGTYTLNGGTLIVPDGAAPLAASIGSTKSTGIGPAGLIVPAANPQQLIVGNAGNGAFIQNANMNVILVLGAKATGNGTYTINAGALTAPSETIGDAGIGLLIQNAGFNIVTTNDLIIGNVGGAQGTYTLNNGVLDVQKGNIRLGVQANATGTFNFFLGAITIDTPQNELDVGEAGTGTFNQFGGTLNDDVVVASEQDSTGTFTLAAGQVTSDGQTIGDAGDGTFTETGGSNMVTTNGLTVGNSNGGSGTYNLGGAGALDIQGGDLIVADAANATGTFNYNIAAGDAATMSIETGVIQVGFHGTANFNQVDGSLVAKVIVGSQIGSHGTYELGGGNLSSLGQVVGNDGTGTFNQDGGTNTIAGGGDLILGSFNLGFGTYQLNNGQLIASNEIIGNDGLGSFVQVGASNLVNGGTTAILALGSETDGGGAYELDAGTLIVGNGTIAAQEIIGNSGKGHFVQKGGSNTIMGGNANLLVGEFFGSSGTYELDSGTLNSSGQTIGDSGQGIFTQKGGTNTIAGDNLLIGVNNAGTYNISGGNLIVQASTLPAHGDIVLGGSFSAPASGSGTIAVSNGSRITVGDNLIVWQGSTVSVLDATSGIDIGNSGGALSGDILVELNNQMFGDGAIDADVVDQGSIIATNSGSFSASNGGTLAITGTVSGSGELIMAAGATLRLNGPLDPGVSVSFDDGAPERLILQNPGSRFANSISNLSAHDAIEFGNGMTITAASEINAGTVEVDFHGSGGVTGTYDLTDVNFGTSAPHTFDTGHDAATGFDFIAVTCFVAGTRIATRNGVVAIEDLNAGVRLRTVLSGTQPIVWIGRRDVDCARHVKPKAVWPVRIAAGAFGPAMPHRDLYLSPDHAVYVRGVLIPVKHLINGRSIIQIPMPKVTYYHIELPRHDVLLAEGLPAESYLDSGNRSNFANGGYTVALYPDFSSRVWEGFGCAPLVVAGQQLAAVRRQLAHQLARDCDHAMRLTP